MPRAEKYGERMPRAGLARCDAPSLDHFQQFSSGGVSRRRLTLAGRDTPLRN